jgi:4-amino-4-deoxy-L-arabinose transferase-like glycosyltransferase
MTPKIRNQGKYNIYLFCLLLCVVYLLMDFQTILFLSPGGLHFTRQTDSLSFVANYLNNGFQFFQPQVFNLTSTGGRAACEFPILYYFTAVLYFIFGEHEFFLRLITLILASAGLIYLYKMLCNLLQDSFYAAVFSFLFLSSTVLLYYISNVLPDGSAFGMTLAGWYLFYSGIGKKNDRRRLSASFLLFTLASLIKVTCFINPVAAILSLVAFDLNKRTGVKFAIRNNIFPLVIFCASLLVVLSWNLYVFLYNKINHDEYFSIQASPIWGISRDQALIVWNYMVDYWYSKYYYPTAFHAFLIITLAGLVLHKRANRMVLIPSIILATGATCYFMLFYAQFKDHDYYFITIIPPLIFMVINSFIALKNRFPGLINNYLSKLVLLTICVLSLNYAREKLAERYSNSNDSFAIIGSKLAGIRDYLDSAGIPAHAKFIIMTDQTPNGGLYFINRPGWSIPDTSAKSIVALRTYIRQGAEYILFTEKRYANIDLDGEKAGEKNGVTLFKLKKPV